MQSRFQPFRCAAVVSKMADCEPCPVHLCKWIVEAAARADAGPAVRPLLPLAQGAAAAAAGGPEPVTGFRDLASAARLPVDKAAALESDRLLFNRGHILEWGRRRPGERRIDRESIAGMPPALPGPCPVRSRDHCREISLYAPPR